MDTINSITENCESDYNTSSQFIFKNLLTDVNSGKSYNLAFIYFTKSCLM